MSKRQKNHHSLTKVFIAIIIFFVIYITHYSLSRYKSTTEAESQTTVAKWEIVVDTTESNNNINLIPGEEGKTYKLKITNASEVSVNYSIIISDLPQNLQVSLDNGTLQNVTNNQVIFTDCGSFGVNEINTTKEHTLTFVAPIGTQSVVDNEVNVNIDFTQKD